MCPYVPYVVKERSIATLRVLPGLVSYLCLCAMLALSLSKGVEKEEKRTTCPDPLEPLP